MSVAPPSANGRTPALMDVWAPGARVSVGDRTLDPDIATDLIEVRVSEGIDAIDTATLVVNNWDPVRLRFKYLGDRAEDYLGLAGPFMPGQRVEIAFGYAGRPETLFRGEITAMRPSYPGQAAPRITLEARDGLHLLRGATHSRAWEDVKDSDVVRDVIDQANREIRRSRARDQNRRTLSAEGVQDTEEQLPHVYQHNVTDAAFLKERARRIDYELYVDGNTVHFHPPRDRSPRTVVLTWGESLVSFVPQLNLDSQLTGVTVRAWNPRTRSVIEYATTDADFRAIAGDRTTGAELRRQHFGENRLVITRIPVHSRGEARDLAVARLRESMNQFITGTGQTWGIPDLRSGRVVVLEGLGPVFSGEYYVTRTQHRFGGDGYRTEFEVRRRGL